MRGRGNVGVLLLQGRPRLAILVVRDVPFSSGARHAGN